MNIKWSDENKFDRSTLNKVPEAPGVYQILQSNPYPRYKGTSRILKIGASKSSLRAEIENHFIRHTAANRLARIRNQKDMEVTYVFAITESHLAIENEKELLKEYENKHWDLPILNSTRGYSRGEDNHYKRTAI